MPNRVMVGCDGGCRSLTENEEDFIVVDVVYWIGNGEDNNPLRQVVDRRRYCPECLKQRLPRKVGFSAAERPSLSIHADKSGPRRNEIPAQGTS